jgi:N-acetylglucosaminyl-diphospho-decaprenol L-rhamnosyltransferase
LVNGAPPAADRAAPPALSLVVVHWRAEEDLARLLAAVPADERFEVIVVDNGTAAPLPDLGGARLVRAGSNLGFGGGANLGAAVARAPLLLVANPDVRPEPGALEALLAGFAALPDRAGLAPRLLGSDGAAQAEWQLRALPRPRQLLLHALFLDAGRRRAAEPAAGTTVAQPAAAVLALRRAAWERLGGFDPTYHPAWFEDVDLARRLAASGGTFAYWPSATFRHRLGGSVAPLGYGPFLWCYHRNLGRYLAKHHGHGWAWAARLLLVAGVGLRIAALPLRRPRHAPSRAAAARGLLTVALGALSGWRFPHRLARAEATA